MGHQIIKQPNGLLAIFESYTDSWVCAEATPEEVADFFAEMAEKESRRRTEVILNQVMAGERVNAYAQLAMTFEEANKKHNKHRPKAFKKGEFIGFPEGEDND